ncbi:hypothetical protein K488DRAFT_57256 [Vararia minispora EC-137]|uniref:Uncharacterized protein n=1 Tax=Vararia minispora EC-137 TaxID=1314806 RepID=A0ACB8QBR1_9AGAM|nr:hypothetical protein K488DRAFT_57256 [Vararia minispora EC-137]
MSHTFEPGVYTLTDDRFGASFDLHGGNNTTTIAYPFHGGENQRWEFINLGAGFAIKSARTHDYLSIDLSALCSGVPAPARTSKFPVCWEIEAQKHVDSTGDDEDEDVLIR